MKLPSIDCLSCQLTSKQRSNAFHVLGRRQNQSRRQNTHLAGGDVTKSPSVLFVMSQRALFPNCDFMEAHIVIRQLKGAEIEIFFFFSVLDKSSVNFASSPNDAFDVERPLGFLFALVSLLHKEPTMLPSGSPLCTHGCSHGHNSGRFNDDRAVTRWEPKPNSTHDFPDHRPTAKYLGDLGGGDVHRLR